jgi:hypothetical protein
VLLAVGQHHLDEQHARSDIHQPFRVHLNQTVFDRIFVTGPARAVSRLHPQALQNFCGIAMLKIQRFHESLVFDTERSVQLGRMIFGGEHLTQFCAGTSIAPDSDK